MAGNQPPRRFAARPPLKCPFGFPHRMAGNQPRRFKVAAACPPLRSPFGFPPRMAGNQPPRRFMARPPSKSQFGLPPEWPAISQEGLKWHVVTTFEKSISSSPPNGQQSTAKKVCGSPAFKKSIWFLPQMANNQPRRFKVATARPSSRNHLVFPPNGRLSTAEKVSSGCCVPTFIIIHAEWSTNSWLVKSPP